MRPWLWMSTAAAAYALVVAASVGAQRTDAFVEPYDHPAIAYTTGAVDNVVDALNRRLADHTVRLTANGPGGYLQSVLTALNVPVESQVLVFSATAFQGKLVSPANPRAIFFNDSVAVGWVRGADVLEFAAHDRRQGAIFYTLAQSSSSPTFERADADCLICHISWDSLGVPGFQVLSTFPRVDEQSYANGFTADHRTPFQSRWGSWFVTGTPPSPVHMGNIIGRRNLGELKTVEGQFDSTGYLSPHSDIVALMVFEHQTRMANLLTRLGWEARIVDDAETPRVREAAVDVADYMLFVDEVPFDRPARGSSSFAERFAALGPRDSKGRSLRDLSLEQRMFQYPCSYLIYSPAFDGLPPHARDLVYRRLWAILSGQDQDPKYRVLSAADRRAIVEILHDTKSGLPDYFKG